ncbi:SGNH/GDSL hydrolase family protein [Nitrobacter winogradskyi]|uniref:Uncharacterized protein n=1 Tax=Nitrobacter winogradskyi TaxID=913 RepID=A0ACC6AK76_NITWI|nr:SGNH family hydrolase [Nitrobacter winogradskyi]MCP2000016.1 hypothetical protein [Nitrobacter winogradskyi]
MSGPRSLLRRLTQRGPWIALAIAVATLVAAPASAQLFNFGFDRPAPARRGGGGGGGGGGGWFGSDNPFFAPFQQPQQRQPQQQQQRPAENYSHAPPPEKRDTVSERNVLVLGDAMADWLAYGLEDALSETSDMGVIRKHKTVSGLIRYQPKGDPADWVAAAKAVLATENPDAIVVMLGLQDRTSIREAPEKDKSGKTDDKKADADPKGGSKTGKADEAAADSDGKPADSEQSPDETADQPAVSRTKSARSPNGVAEFRSDRWVELYSRKIDDMITVLKSKGVPVFWVALPAVRGAKSTADMLFLNSLYRDAADKAGITYVDIWDGFVDEAGRYIQQGPDFEGQIRRLRSYDGVFFTKAGSRKLAHYVEREITRVMAARSGPVAIPVEPDTPDTDVKPGQPAPRPLAGPIVPLVASSFGTDRLLGGPGSHPAAIDALAARTLVRGEPLSAPAGRADDFAWPRREVGLEPAKGDPPVAAAPEAAGAASAAKPNKPRLAPSAQQAQSNGLSGSRAFSPAQAGRSQAPSRPPADFGLPGFFSDLFSR